MNATPPSASIEPAQLRQELEALRQELRELRQFLRVDPAADGQPATLNITCTTLTLCNPQGQSRGRLMAIEDAAFLAFDGSDGRQRVFLGMDKMEPVLEFQTGEQKPTVLIHAEPETGRGEIVVFDNERPRAVMKANKEGGSLAVTHDAGTPVVGMVSQITGGQMALFTPEGKIAIRMFSDTAASPKGGMITVSRQDGRPVASLLAGKNGGAMMIMDEKDFQVAISAGNDGGSVIVNSADKQSSINVQGVAGGYSGISICDSKNKSVAQLCAEDQGGALIVHDRQNRERAVIRMAEKGPFLHLKTGGEKNRHPVHLSAINDEGALILGNPRGDTAALNMTKDSGALMFMSEAKVIQLHLGFDEKQAGLHLKPQGDANSVAALVTQEQGGLLMVSAPDGIRRCHVCAMNDGGQLCLFNDFGIERVTLGSAQDGGAMKLKWGGTPGVIALATDQGGCLVAYDADGQPAASLPPREDEPGEFGS